MTTNPFATRKCMNCKRQFTKRASDPRKKCFTCDKQFHKMYRNWTDTGLECYLSNEDCDRCQVHLYYNLSKRNGCKQPQANQILLSQNIPIPETDAHRVLGIPSPLAE